MLLAPVVSLFMCYISATTSFIYSSPSIARYSVSLRGSRSPRRNSGGFQNISNYIKNIKPKVSPLTPLLPKPSFPLTPLSPLTLAALAVPEVQSSLPLTLTPHTMLSLLTLATTEVPSPSLLLPITKEANNASSVATSEPLKIQRYSKENISSIIKNFSYYNTLDDIPFTGDQINITSIYLNIEKVKGVYFAKDANNVIFTLQDNLANLYYYCGGSDAKASGDAKASSDAKASGIYKISNNTRINMKAIDRFVFQSFNNDADGILF
jgi:hypothetical protein